MNGTKLPTATRAAAIAADGQYDQLALQLLDSVVRGDFDVATAYFDSEMQQKLTPPVIAAMWAASEPFRQLPIAFGPAGCSGG